MINLNNATSIFTVSRKIKSPTELVDYIRKNSIVQEIKYIDEHGNNISSLLVMFKGYYDGVLYTFYISTNGLLVRQDDKTKDVFDINTVGEDDIYLKTRICECNIKLHRLFNACFGTGDGDINHTVVELKKACKEGYDYHLIPVRNAEKCSVYNEEVTDSENKEHRSFVNRYLLYKIYVPYKYISSLKKGVYLKCVNDLHKQLKPNIDLCIKLAEYFGINIILNKKQMSYKDVLDLETFACTKDIDKIVVHNAVDTAMKFSLKVTYEYIRYSYFKLQEDNCDKVIQYYEVKGITMPYGVDFRN